MASKTYLAANLEGGHATYTNGQKTKCTKVPVPYIIIYSPPTPWSEQHTV